MLSCVKTKRGSGVIMCENKKREWCVSCVKTKKGEWWYHV